MILSYRLLEHRRKALCWRHEWSNHTHSDLKTPSKPGLKKESKARSPLTSQSFHTYPFWLALAGDPSDVITEVRCDSALATSKLHFQSLRLLQVTELKPIANEPLVAVRSSRQGEEGKPSSTERKG